MSYHISLYQSAFLRHAIKAGLGDWTHAPPLAPEAIETAVREAIARGFVFAPHDPDFVAFVKSEGEEVSSEYLLDDSRILATFSVFSNSLSFVIPFGSRADASVVFAREFGLQLAESLGLGFDDPQAGESHYFGEA